MDAEAKPHSEAKTTVAQHADVFERVEHLAYAAVGVLLSVAAAIALAAAVWALGRDIQDWGSTGLIADLIERLLFVLMLVEILHTVRASMRHGGLRAEPFLIVGIIASIRRVLVSTLETTTGQAESGFRNSMLELAVLGFLIIVMVVSIYLLRRREHGDSLRD